jgi:hypothetical protein
MNYRRIQTVCAALTLLAGMPVSARQSASGRASSNPRQQKPPSIEISLQAEAELTLESTDQDTGWRKASSQVQTENSEAASAPTSNTEVRSKASQSSAADQESVSTKATSKLQTEETGRANDPTKAKSTSIQQPEAGTQAESAIVPSRLDTKRKEYAQFSSQDYAQVPALYQLELERAHARGDKRTEAALALKQARAFDFLSGTDPNLIANAEAAYKRSITASLAAGDPVQRSMAANNLSVLLLKEGKVSEAGQALSQIDFSSIPQNQQPIFRFNIGRVQELNGNMWEAYRQYSQAFAANSTLVTALKGAFRTLGKQTMRSEVEAATLSERATANGLPDIANEQLLSLLESWDDQQLKQNPGGAERLMTALVSAYAAQDLTPRVFQTREGPRLQKISALHGSLTEVIKEIEVAYLGTFSFSPREAAVSLAAWRFNNQSAQSMAMVLAHIADFYETNGQPEMALGRYGAGWEIAHAPQCAVKYSSLLSRTPRLDPGDRLVDSLVQEIFIEKGQAYIIGDWAHILPLHIALGTIFEERRKWGENGDPRGALFQWQHAIRADAEMRRQNSSTPPSPGLHIHLGNVFRGIKRNEDAVREFLAAGEGFIAVGDLAEARKSARVILELSPGGLSGSWGAIDRSRWEELARVTGVA